MLRSHLTTSQVSLQFRAVFRLGKMMGEVVGRDVQALEVLCDAVGTETCPLEL